MTDKKTSKLVEVISNAIRAERKRARDHRGSNGADYLARSVAAALVDKSMLTMEVHGEHLEWKRKNR